MTTQIKEQRPPEISPIDWINERAERQGECTVVATNGSTYPQIVVDGVAMPVHQYVARIRRGDNPDPSNLQVRHLCGNFECVSANHLAYGPVWLNAVERQFDSHKVITGANSISKLWRNLREIYTDERTQRIIAAHWGISQQQVSSIKTGRQYGWATSDL